MSNVTDKNTAVEADPAWADLLVPDPGGSSPPPTNRVTTLRLTPGGSFVVVRLVTTAAPEVPRHWFEGDDGDLRCFVRCNQLDCVLCCSGARRDSVKLLAVLDVLSERLAILEVPFGEHAGALLPQLRAIMRVALAEGRAIKISRLDRSRYHVVLLERVQNPGLEIAVAALTEAVQRKDIDPTVVVRSIDNTSLVRASKAVRNALKMIAPDHPALAAAESDEL